ncbi:hypothetical protein [Actinomadura chokoriensis]|uniref:hypothetical protein n=1 Tax=Actinomadura chokoriensis TaxID=454156 RepID=UPI0031FA1529
MPDSSTGDPVEAIVARYCGLARLPLAGGVSHDGATCGDADGYPSEDGMPEAALRASLGLSPSPAPTPPRPEPPTRTSSTAASKTSRSLMPASDVVISNCVINLAADKPRVLAEPSASC